MKLDAKFYVQTAHLSAHDLGTLVRLIIAGPGGDAIPEHLAPMLERSRQLSVIRSEAGKKGGRPRKKVEAEPVVIPKPKPKETLVIEWPPWAGPKVKQMWEEFKEYKMSTFKHRYKNNKTEQQAINLLGRYFNSGQRCYIALETTMAKGWRFPVDPKEYSYNEPELQFTPNEN